MADNKTQIIITAKDETRAAIASAQQGLQSLTAGAASLGLQLGALGGVASLGGIGLMAKQAIDAADNLGKMAQKVGVSVESLSALEYAGKLSDVSLEQLGTGLKKLSVNLNEVATNADGDAAAAFKAIGVSVKDAAGNLRNADDVFADVAEAFAGMKDGAGKTALAVAIFGKAGSDLIPMLNAGAKGLAEMRGEAEALGLVFTGDTAKQAEAFNDNLTRLAESSRGFGNEVATIVLPTLSQLAQEFVNSAKEGTGFASMLGAGVKTTLEAIAVTGANVVYVFKAIGSEIGGIAAQMAALARGDFQGFKFIGEAMKEEGAKARAELDKLQQRILNPQAPEAGTARAQRDAPIFGGGKDKSGRAVDAEAARRDEIIRMAKEAEKELERIAKDREDKERDLEQRLRAMLGGTTSYKLAEYEKQKQALRDSLQIGEIDPSQFVEAMAVVDDAITKLTDDGADKFKDLERAIDGWGKSSAKAMADFVTEGKSSFSDLARSIINDLLQMAIYQNITKPLFEGVQSSGFFGEIAGAFGFGGGRANGGPVTPGQYYVVGENGPEVLVPGMSGTVIPNGGGGGGMGLVVNIIEAPGRGGETQQRQENGQNMLDVFVDRVRGAIAGDIARGSGPVPAALNSTYGLGRVAGAY
jgi:hypothetical protein